MKLKFTFLLAFLFVSVPLLMRAQDEKPVFDRMNGFGFVPQYTIAGGLRFDYDRCISGRSNQWLIFSPQVYSVSDFHFDHNFENLFGLGLDVKHRIFLNASKSVPRGVYVQYGLMFQYFIINDEHSYTEPFTENGVQYYHVVYGPVETRLNKAGGNFHIGYQWLIGNKIYIDLYAGTGIRISHNNLVKGFDPWYNNYWIDYGYSGTLLDGGLRFGFYFK
jgi:hypothetical protein